MGQNSTDLAQNSTDLAEMLKVLTAEQLRYVAARASRSKDQDALKDVGIHRSTLARWKQEAPIDEVVRLIAQDNVLVAREKLRRAAAEAVDVLLDDLDGRKHSKIRQDAAKDVLDRLGVKAPTQVELAGKDGGPLVVQYVNDWRGDGE